MFMSYEEWEPIYDYGHFSYYVNPKRPWLKYYPENIPKSIRFDPIPVHEFIRLTAEKYPNNVAINDLSRDKKYTYREVFWYADKIANALIDLGVNKDHSVGVMTKNIPEFIFTIFGITETGASVSPINPLLRESDVIHIIQEAGNINTIFVHKDNYRTIKKVRRSLEIENIILLESKEPREDTITFEEFILHKSTIKPQIEIDPVNDIAALLFTGGTTGLPKGVMLTHNNLVHNALSVLNMEKTTFEENRGIGVSLAILPLCHTFGYEVSIISMAAATMMIMIDSFDPGLVLKLIEKYRIKLFTGVPIMFQMLVNHPDFSERDLSSLESATSGSAALAPEISKKWEKKTGIKVGQGFGLTEASPITHMQPNWIPEIKPESIGIPIIDTDAIIVNPDTLEELGVNEIGELLIRGPQVMKGYWKRPKATEKIILKDGWLRTGDLARMDENGYFYIEGRTKDMIKYKGYKVMPKEVEEKLYKHPAVLEVGVIGIPDPYIGETIKAFIVLKKEYRDGKITERDIIKWAKEHLASYKYPRHIEFVNSLPRTAVGKIFRRKLKDKEKKK